MSRYTITVTRTALRHADPDAVIGYDRPLQTFFLQAFADSEGENLALWLGTNIRAFETLSDLRAAAIALGYDFVPIASGTLCRLLDDYAREAICPVPDSIVQDLQPQTH
ncbi:hypothetical protein ATY77_08495 [Rhizobium sp. R634]|uniref:hypothetical protein n=1 Tax=Rhizobium sp. R634 TaxID=1764274 RepID=UPI000B537D3C|nr:hypothetical protein [Rhizobium sp. R634]OWV73034.1 hypothetical protein ATY77_07245 [Rhizobium sp. R634]OWV73253.1 hypothetical protein ATY77_08495 [Rhizobium sp. R634]